MLMWTPREREHARRLNEELGREWVKATGRKSKAPHAKPISKPSSGSRRKPVTSKSKSTPIVPQASDACRITRDESAQREWAIERSDGSLVIPGVRFSTRREAQKVLDALLLISEALPKEMKDKPQAVPNRPEFHESVQAVRGQAPRI
jgi:hypothetical protein